MKLSMLVSEQQILDLLQILEQNFVEVERGFVGSSATSHTDGTSSRIYKGSYNIVDDSIFFTKAPRGNPNIRRTNNNLDIETSEFTGRVFLRQDYTTNEIYDDYF